MLNSTQISNMSGVRKGFIEELMDKKELTYVDFEGQRLMTKTEYEILKPKMLRLYAKHLGTSVKDLDAVLKKPKTKRPMPKLGSGNNQDREPPRFY